jgi:hypothetical protein
MGRLAASIVASSVASIVFSLILSFATALGQTDRLINGGFEAGTSGWTASSDTSFVTVTTPVSSGNWAASLSDLDTDYDIYIYQQVPVFPGATYTLTGWAYNNEPDFYRVCLRVHWPPPVEDDREECLDGEADFYQPLTVGPLVAPANVDVATIIALAEIRLPDPPSPIYFDEISLTCSLTPRLYVPLVSKNYPR